MRPLATALLLVLAGLSGCKGGKGPPPPASGSGTGGAASAQGEADLAYVTTTAPLRREPTDAPKVAGPNPKAQVPNAVALLQRGEKVTVLESREEWARVRASDETAGWMRRSVLLPAAGVVEATLLQPADAFDRPDLLAVNARRKIEPGTLLLGVRSRELFSEISVAGAPNAWVLTDRLSANPREVMVAKLVDKARWLKRSGKADEAKQVLELARKEFPDVGGLVEVLAAELGEPAPGTPPPEGGVAPMPPPAPPPGR